MARPVERFEFVIPAPCTIATADAMGSRSISLCHICPTVGSKGRIPQPRNSRQRIYDLVFPLLFTRRNRHNTALLTKGERQYRGLFGAPEERE